MWRPNAAENWPPDFGMPVAFSQFAVKSECKRDYNCIFVSVTIATYATDWTARGSNPVGERDISLLQIIQTGSGAHLAFCSMGTGFLPRGQSRRGGRLTTHIHLVPRLRMSGAVPLLPLYAFMAWTGKTLIYLFVMATVNQNKGVQDN